MAHNMTGCRPQPSRLSRRAVLAGAALLGTGAAPFDTAQAPSFYRYKVGAMEVTVVNDGMSRFPVVDGFVTNVPQAQVRAALTALFMDPDVYAAPYNPIVVNTGRKLVVIDTGTGEAAFRASNGLNGRFLPNLAAAGIDPAAVDAVVISHYHGDHINGLLRADGSPAFPQAEILVPAPEHRFWTDEGEASRASPGRMQDGFRNVRRVMAGEILKRVRTYEWGAEVVPGITSVATPGHTPGHSSHVLGDGGQAVFVQGDVTHAPYLFARHPDWHVFLDVDAAAAEQTRRTVYDRLVADRMAVQGFHYPFPSLAHVEKDGAGFREVIAPWNPLL